MWVKKGVWLINIEKNVFVNNNRTGLIILDDKVKSYLPLGTTTNIQLILLFWPLNFIKGFIETYSIL